MRALSIVATIASVAALNNGLGRTPAMGYSTWNDCSSMRDNGPNGWCWNTEDHIKNVTLFMVSSGLAALGYEYINVDEGWLAGRNAQGLMYEDLSKFPSGMKGLGDWVHAQEITPGSGRYLKYGLYSCRGSCQCGTGTYNAPGSLHYEAADVDWMVAAGADYLKIDSCCGSQDHATAFSDYAKFRDAMNKTNNRVWFSLCGWESWYSPPDPSLNYTGGASLGNSWRIAGDGSGWGPLTNCMNVMADSGSQYSGPGGWADPDLLIGPQVYVGGQTDEQARAQFTMWCMFPANLLISQNVLAWSAYAFETYSNAELIAVNQDALGSPAKRLVGKDLAFPCSGGGGALAGTKAVACDAKDPLQQWDFDASSGVISLRGDASWALDAVDCGTADGTAVSVFPRDGGDGNCAGKNQRWTLHADGTLTNGNSGSCLDVYDWTGPVVDTWTCNGGSNQNFSWSAASGLLRTADGGAGKSSMCVAADPSAASSCTNVWGRTLADGYALAFVNNGGVQNVTCDSACFASLGALSGSYNVRDLWAHAVVGQVSPPYTFTAAVNGSGFAALYKLSPA